jgi:deoxyadenosine/deoxycytidine kinase
MRLSHYERGSLVEIGKRLGRRVLPKVAMLVKTAKQARRFTREISPILVARLAEAFHNSAMYIAVEGCIAAGKTTIARGLASSRKALLLEENFESNPFIRAFYKDPIKHVVEAEFGFLLIHYHQMLCTSPGPSQDLISDYLFDKDLVYADLNFPNIPEKQIFRDLHGVLAGKLRQPDLVIFLSAPNQLIFERIKKRQRDYEQEIDFTYYGRLNAAYELFFQKYDQSPLIAVEVAKCDFANDPSLAPMLSRTANDVLDEGKTRCSFPRSNC